MKWKSLTSFPERLWSAENGETVGVKTYARLMEHARMLNHWLDWLRDYYPPRSQTTICDGDTRAAAEGTTHRSANPPPMGNGV
jgi:hypothetical protein